MTFGAEEYDAACDRQMEFWLDVIRHKKKGRPDGQPFHCRAVVRLNCCDDAVDQTAPSPVEVGTQLTDAGDRGDRQ